MMIPLNWCVNMVRDEINHSKPLIPKEGKVILQEILKFKKNLHRIHQHNSNDLPQICKQAVQCSVWFFLLFGALALQPCTNEGYKQLFTVRKYNPLKKSLPRYIFLYKIIYFSKQFFNCQNLLSNQRWT